MTNGNHLNSVAGVLKSYFRKLEEPLFSQAYFDQLMNITRKITTFSILISRPFFIRTPRGYLQG